MRQLDTVMIRLCVLVSIVASSTAACTSSEPARSAAPTSTAAPEPAAPRSAEPSAPAEPSTTGAGPRMGAGCAQLVDFDAHLADLRVSARDVATARRIMRAPTPDPSTSPDAQHAVMLRAELGDPMPALAHLLVDDDLGDAVAFTMFEIDEARAAPLVFASMPKSDRNVQSHSFKRFLRRMSDVDAPCWDAVVRDAAVRTLEAGTNADAAEVALFALGATGTRGDIDLLRRYLAHPSSAALPQIWQDNLTHAARAALARLGDREATAALRVELDVPVRPLDRDSATRLVAAIDAAGFSRQRSFVDLLCRHLAAPGVPPDGHMLSQQPSERAAAALAAIVEGATPGGTGDVARWTTRCRERAL